MENDKEMFGMEFTLYIPSAGTTTTVKKSFHQYYPNEFGNVILELQSCLIACGYPEKLVYKYIPEIE